MTRHFLRSICRMLIGVVVLTQMAVAAYACPGLAAAKMQMSSVVAVADDLAGTADTADTALQPMANCEDMVGAVDPSFANLCAEHCHHGQQSDQVATLTVPAALLNALYVTPAAPEPSAAPRPAADATSARAAACAPLAILHCCFRI